MSPLLLLKIVVPETKILAPASITNFELLKSIPPSTSISNFKFFFNFIFFNSLIFFKTSGINFCPPIPDKHSLLILNQFYLDDQL